MDYFEVCIHSEFGIRWQADILSANQKCCLLRISRGWLQVVFPNLDNTDTETISAFRLRLYWLKLPYLLVDWVIFVGMPVGADGRSVGRADGRAYGHVTTKISRMHRSPNFLTHRTPLGASRTRELRYQVENSRLRIVFKCFKIDKTTMLVFIFVDSFLGFLICSSSRRHLAKWKLGIKLYQCCLRLTTLLGSLYNGLFLIDVR